MTRPVNEPTEEPSARHARLRDQQQADLDGRLRPESFLLPEDKEWLRTWN